MTDPTQRQQQFEQATNLRLEAIDYIDSADKRQRERWGILGQVIDRAVAQYVAMRIGAIEESLKDKSASLWLSCIITVAVTLVPVSAVTGVFLSALVESSRKRLVNADRMLATAATKLATSHPKVSVATVAAYQDGVILSTKYRQLEELSLKFRRIWEPEISNTFQNIVQKQFETLFNPPFRQDAARMMARTNAPTVQVMGALYGWMNQQIKDENEATELLRDRMRYLSAIATSPKPEKEAKAREEEARKKEGIREFSGRPRRPVQELPKTNEKAMEELTDLRNRLAPTTIEMASSPLPDDLADLQLMIEGMIWASTYDFSIVRKDRMVSDPLPAPLEGYFDAAPLPKGLWPKLIERFIDFDEGKTYKGAGNLARLGSKKAPFFTPETMKSRDYRGPRTFTPETRLSLYFSNELYPKINEEHSLWVEKAKRF